MLGAPEPDAVLQVGSPEGTAEGQNQTLCPAFDAAQDTDSFLGCKCALPAHIEIFAHEHPQMFLPRASLDPVSLQPVLVLGIALLRSMTLHLDYK